MLSTFYPPQNMSFPALPVQPPLLQSMQSQNPYGTPSVAIDPSPVYLQQLRSMAHSRETLVKNGFVMTPLSEADVVGKKRCRRCNLRCSRAKKFVERSVEQGHRKSPKEPAASQSRENQPSALIALNDKQSKGNETEDKPSKAVLKCQHHTGRVIRAHWTCCQSFVSHPGCTWAPEHLTRDYKPGDLLTRHQLHNTPLSTLVDLTPAPLISVYGAAEATYTESGLARHPRRAVAIDCEMGTASDGESELIRLSVVDFFTAEILLDSLVSPAVPMEHYNTRYSGVSRQDMEEARRKGTCINGGVAAAREQVWKWVGPETIVIGHSVNNDLASLRWIHPLVVDSFLLASAAKAEKLKREEEEEEEEERKKAAALAAAAALSQSGDLMSFDNLEPSPNEEGPENSGQAEKDKHQKRSRGGLSLKALALELLGRHIQVGRAGHDSLEDALAARDLVHWYVMEKMEEKRAQSEHDALVGF